MDRWSDSEWASEGGVPYVLWFHFPDIIYQRMTLSIPSVNLIERVCHLTNKIYRDVLCITTQGRPGISYITIGGLDRVRVSTSSTSQYRITLSLDLLDWISWKYGIPCSFTDFITTPELSGPLYISPDIYHTQITEYSLEKFQHQWALFSLHRTSS